MLILVALALFHGAVIAEYYAKSPSAMMSREIEISRSEWVTAAGREDIVLSLPSPDGKSATVIVPNTGNTSILVIDDRGEVTAETSIDTDLSESWQITGSHLDGDRIVLFSRERLLERIDLNRTTGVFTRKTIDSEVRRIEQQGHFLVAEKDDGLYAMQVREGSGLVKVAAGPIHYYAVTEWDNRLKVAAVFGGKRGRFDVRILTCGPSLEVRSVATVFEGSLKDRYRRIEDVSAYDGVIDLLFLQKNTRSLINDLTVVRVSADNGNAVTEYRTAFRAINTEYEIIDADLDSVTFLMRLRTAYGRNLAACAISSDGVVVSELTKTRGTSNQSAFFRFGEWNALIFSEVGKGHRAVYFASEQPVVVQKSTRWDITIIGRAFAAMIINTVMAMFVGALYLFFSALVPALAVLGTQRFFSDTRAAKLVLVAVGGFIYTGIKLYVTYFVINHTSNYVIGAPVIGSEPIIYFMLIFTSVVSYLLSVRFLQPETHEDKPAIGILFHLIGIDSVQYAMLFIVYVVTSLLLGKI